MQVLKPTVGKLKQPYMVNTYTKIVRNYRHKKKCVATGFKASSLGSILRDAR